MGRHSTKAERESGGAITLFIGGEQLRQRK